MTNLSIFNFNQSKVRVNILDSEPLFCLSDVTEILNVKNSHASRFKLSEKGIHKMYTLTSGGKQELLFINEPNLYRVIFRSNKKEAIDFQNWVFDEVLPKLRKTGSYSITINLEQQQAIRQAVSQRAYRTGEHHQAVYHKLYEYFKIPRYQDLPASRFEDAIKFLGGVINYQDITLTISNLNCLISHSLWIFNFWRENQLYKAFSMIGSDFGVRLQDHIHSCYSLSKGLKIELERSKGLNYTYKRLPVRGINHE